MLTHTSFHRTHPARPVGGHHRVTQSLRTHHPMSVWPAPGPAFHASAGPLAAASEVSHVSATGCASQITQRVCLSRCQLSECEAI